jgi:hypothetical protein
MHSVSGFVFYHKGEHTVSSTSKPEANQGVEHLKPIICVQTGSHVGIISI